MKPRQKSKTQRTKKTSRISQMPVSLLLPESNGGHILTGCPRMEINKIKERDMGSGL